MHLHPEFGYFCPSFRLRGRIRLAAVLVALGALLGGSVVLVTLAGRSADARDRAVATATEETPSAQDIASLPIPAEVAATASAETEHSAARNRADCDDLVGSFLDRSCHHTDPRKRHAQRADHRVATVLIGHASQPAASGADDASSTVATAETIPLPVKRPTTVTAKPKIAQSRDTKPAPKDTTISAYAPAGELEARNTRTGDVPPPFGGLFGLH
jgi:hypothetical protein